MSTHNIGFYEDLTKIIFELSSNMHLYTSAATLRSINPLSVPLIWTAEEIRCVLDDI